MRWERGLTLAGWLFGSPLPEDGAVDGRSAVQFVAGGARKYHRSF